MYGRTYDAQLREAAQQQAPSPSQPPMDFAQVMAEAQKMADQGGLLARTDRPDEPVTAGLPVGPGPGPEAMTAKFGSPTLATLNRLFQATGDPMWARLASKVRR